jgi:hypothetical protein
MASAVKQQGTVAGAQCYRAARFRRVQHGYPVEDEMQYGQSASREVGAAAAADFE